MGRLLVIDDDLSLREMMELMLRGAGHQVTLAEDGLKGYEAAVTGNFEVIISDIKMPGLTGLEVLQRLKAIGTSTPLILVSAYAQPDTVVEAMRAGAYDFIPKPFKPNDLLTVVDGAMTYRSVEEERRVLAEMVEANQRFGRMVGASPVMLHVYDLIRRAAQTSTSILITGESGTGKELVAKAVHENSDRADGEFVAINCGGMPENLVESELFGHKKGAFTGATTDKKGLVALADGGTLFLDELGELSLPMQVKLLRVIQEKTFRPVGGDREECSDVRFISATNRNLETEIMAGRFREDLYYRLNVINIRLPSLRERTADIPLLAQFFLEKYSRAQKKDVRKLSAYALDILSRYHFPGNVRELENIIERSVALEQSGIILPESLRLADFKRSGAIGPGAVTPGLPGAVAAPFSVMMPPLAGALVNPPLASHSGQPLGGGLASFPGDDGGGGLGRSGLGQAGFPPVPGEAGSTLLPGLPMGGLDDLLTALEVYYLYRALVASGSNRGRTADSLSISPWRLRTRLVSYELSDLNRAGVAALGEARFPKPILPPSLAPDWGGSDLNLDDILLTVERHYIHEALTTSFGNKTEAASLLGLSRRSFQHRLERTDYERFCGESHKSTPDYGG